MNQSPEISGGGGFTFEDAPVAIYLGALLGEEAAPGLEGRTIVRVAVQQAAYGEPLDDLIVDGRGADDSLARLSLQTKRELTISAATTNNDFREIVTRAWATLQKPDFRENIDRVGAVTGTVSEASRRAFDTACEWARASNSRENFLDHFQPGAAGADKRNVVRAIQDILGDDNSATSEDKAYRLLRHFVLIRVDVLHEGATDEAHAIERLRPHLHEAGRANDLWHHLLRLARNAAGKAQEFSRLSLLAHLRGGFRLAGVRSLRADLERIMEETRNALDSIAREIDGVEIARPALVASVKRELETRRFVTIVGLAGTGKSAVLHACVLDAMQAGTVLLLKSDRLTGPSWAAHARTLGLTAPTIEALLSEISATGSSVLFIDGIDRVELAQRGVIADILNAIHRSTLLSHWKIVATCRDNGIEPLRTWLPPTIFGGGGVATVEVPAFNDGEAEQLAQAKPVLRPLLFGDDRVKEIARRPFFAAVLVRSLTVGLAGQPAPQSEVELLNVWWSRGGYDSGDQRIYQRQRTLIQLAKSGAVDLGRRIRLEGMDAEAIRELRQDGIIKDVTTGHTVQFAHDIFFEWAFLHLLIDRDDAWVDEIRSVGEPPVLGRVVELFSQAKLTQAGEWERNLATLETSGMRPQWTRAWLIAPFGAPTFWDNSAHFTEAVLRNKEQRLSKLAVWFQAEKTRANPFVLNRTFGGASLARREIVRLAEALAWPSEPASWGRFCIWAISGLGEFPTQIIPDLLAAFEVWQNMFADISNAVSEQIFSTALGWLEDIEAREHPEEFSYNPGRWSELERGGIKELEQRLRNLVLRAARVEQERVRSYLVKVRDWERLRKHAFREIAMFTPTLVANHSVELAEIAKLEIIEDLPASEQAGEDRRGMFSHGISYHDWNRLAIHDDYGMFYPASPLREPFASLFRTKPDEARVLVAEITNHAIMAWRQLHNLDRERRATPIPLEFEFPWGMQKFWGNGRVYMWPRGHWAPHPVICGLMALEDWAFNEVEQGRGIDEVIRDVLECHGSSAVLSIATALALSRNAVSATTLPLATSQKIWEWDIARSVQESGSDGVASNMMGFTKPMDREHALAVRNSNARPARRMEIRWLASLFVISGDDELRTKAQTAITAFPDNLAFDVEEEKAATQHVAKKRRTAEIWSEWGKLENYRATPAPDGSGTYIQLENPNATAPDVVAATENSVRLNSRLELLNWAHTSFESKAIASAMTVEAAVERARAVDRPDLFAEPHGEIIDALWDRDAVAGVAAVVIAHGGNLDRDTLSWCTDVTFRAAATPEFVEQGFFAGSKHLYHPCLFAARGLEGLILRDKETKAAKEMLLRLAGHVLEEVSESAIAIALSLWERDAAFAWIALKLGAQISIGVHSARRSAFGHDHATEADRIAEDVRLAIVEFGANAAPAALPDVPPAWVQGRRRRYGDDFEDEDTDDDDQNERELIWREPDEFVRWDFMPKVLGHIPIATALRDAEHAPMLLDFIYRLLKWTLDKLEPVWKDARDQRDHRATQLGEWRLRFSHLLAKAALELDETEIQNKILAPIFALNDEAAASLINPFTDILVAGGIIDPPRIVPGAIQHMKACVERVLRDHAWERARYNDGDIYGYDLPEIVRVFLFATGVQAGQSSRFANGDWRDVAAVLPIIDPFVRAVGDVPHVIGSFLTLCESAVEHYPPDVFVDQIGEVLTKQSGVPIGWYGTTIPSRIAALIHAFAERSQPLSPQLAQSMLRILDRLVDMGDRRSAALQTSEIFKNVRQAAAQ
jgi:hypothetical protein